MIKIDLIKSLEWFSERWYSKYTLVLLLILTVSILISLFTGIDLSKIELNEWILLFFILIIVFLFWIISTRLPKNSKNKVGFIIAIHTENKEQFKKLKGDFIDSLREYMNNGNLRHQFNFIVYPDFYAKKINNYPTASKLLHKSKAHFMIYGRSRERKIEGKTHFVLNMEGVVSHRPVPNEVSRNLSKEFIELFPRKLAISQENDLFTFDIISNWVNLVAKYIVGIASYISGDFEYSKELFFSLKSELHQIKTNFITISKIKQRIPNRLAETLSTMAKIEYFKYQQQKEKQYLEKMGELLAEVEKVSYDHYTSNILRSIYYFVSKRDVKAAIKELKKNSDIREGTWRFNYAFLKAYEGDLDIACRTYKNAIRYKYPDTVPIETEEFINEILMEEPDKIQLYFCLGMINYYAKCDYSAAKRDFQLFLDNTSTSDSKFQKHRKLAKTYLLDIDSKIEIKN